MSATGIELARADRSVRAGGLCTALLNLIAGPFAFLFLFLMVWRTLHAVAPAFDWRFAYHSAGQRVLLGESPYAWTPAQFSHGLAFVYPALSAVMFAPLSSLGVGFGSAFFTFVCVGLVPATLWLLGVRDWRVYGFAVLGMPFYGAMITANESLFLMFGTACLWRFRDRSLVAAFLVAAMISLKTLMWPLALWLLVTRRWRASAYSLAFGLALNLVAWSLIGFGQISAYVHAAGMDTTDSWRTGFGIPAVMGHLGASRGTGTAVMLVCSVVLVAMVAHRGLVRRDQLGALTLTIALALVSSPLLWSHYLVLLMVPLALLRPRLNWVWAMPLPMWVAQPAAPVNFTLVVLIWLAAVPMVFALARQREVRAPAVADVT